jgi:hypothetical protein
VIEGGDGFDVRLLGEFSRAHFKVDHPLGTELADQLFRELATSFPRYLIWPPPSLPSAPVADYGPEVTISARDRPEVAVRTENKSDCLDLRVISPTGTLCITLQSAVAFALYRVFITEAERNWPFFVRSQSIT